MKYIILLTLAFLLTCCDSFTEVPLPETQIPASEVFQEKASATAALADIYARIREEGVLSGAGTSGTVLLANYSDDMVFYGTNVSIEQFAKHTLLPSNALSNTMWRATYSHIYAANAFLEGMQASTKIKAEDRQRFIGEGLFIRAYLHFYLTNMYGNIPYIRTTNYDANANAKRNTNEEIYSLLLTDLEQAQTALPETYPTVERVCPNRAVATALLARISLYNGNWQMAETYATEVLNDTQYQWQLDITLEFLKDSPSALFALHPGVAGTNTKDARTFIFTSGPPSRSALSPELVTSFEPGDLRRTNWIKTINGAAGPWYHANKYKRTATTGTATEYTILFRLAEMYLVRAEARAKQNNYDGARFDLNKIRNRAGLADATVANGQLLDAIAAERRHELFTEQGHRWFDLKRTGKAHEVLSVVKPNWEPHHIVFPLPENELLLNPNLLPQNTGY